MRFSPDDHLRTIDELCATRDWDGLLGLRDHTRAEVGRRSMTSIAALCEYRLALLAPARLACGVLNDNTGFASVGPLAEVLAQQHSWEEVVPYLDDGRVASSVAQERVLRGDDLRSTGDIYRSAFDMPMALLPWESSYPRAIYQPDEATFPQPGQPSFSPVSRLPRPGRRRRLQGSRSPLDHAVQRQGQRRYGRRRSPQRHRQPRSLPCSTGRGLVRASDVVDGVGRSQRRSHR
jgi:hypothetical protein